MKTLNRFLYSLIAIPIFLAIVGAAMWGFPRTVKLTAGDVSPAAWSVEFVAPSYTSGEDFATTVVGNPWDMNGTDDVDAVWTRDLSSTQYSGEIQTYSAQDGILDVVTNDTGRGCNAPWAHRPLALNLGGHKIDEQKYKYFTFRYKLNVIKLRLTVWGK